MVKFVCACCGEQAEQEVSDEEALAEYGKVFSESAPESVAVCGVCYSVLMADDPAAALKDMITEITGQDL